MHDSHLIYWSQADGLEDSTKLKLDHVMDLLAGSGPLGICFSGGVDSSLLLALALKARPHSKTLAFTAAGPAFPSREASTARKFCKTLGAEQVVVDFAQLEVPGLSLNPLNRCYICKMALFDALKVAGGEQGIDQLVDGTNADDLLVYRPGLKALKEQGVASPLAEAGLSKEEVRKAARALGLGCWDKASTPCLATRFEYGHRLEAETMKAVDECENALFDLGFSQSRVRFHESCEGCKVARIELADDEAELFANKELRAEVISKLKEHGFDYVSLDLQGFRSGSMDKIGE